MSHTNIGILIFDGVEVLDFAGPYEVFSRTRLEPGTESRRTDDSAPFRVFTVAKTKETIAATGGLKVTPDFGFDDAPRIDLLLVPGGFGTRPLLEDETSLGWIGKVAAEARLVTSVCTGSLVLARLGLLKDKKATTHWAALDLLNEIDPTIDVQRKARFVHDGVITSAGVSAGIDMAFSIVQKLCGADVAEETARYIDYPKNPAAPG